MTNLPTKACSVCGLEKPASEEHFSRQAKGKYGFKARCKICQAVGSRAYFQKNREKVLETNRGYKDRAPDRAGAATRARAANKRAKAVGRTEKLSVHHVLSQLEGQAFLCFYCKGDLLDGTYTVDHVIPLSRGGSNAPDNVVCACGTCNCSKHDRLLFEWAGPKKPDAWADVV